MTKTDPQAYLTEAAEKRVAAGNLVAEAETLEQHAREHGLHVPGDDFLEAADDTSEDADNTSEDADKKSRFSLKK